MRYADCSPRGPWNRPLARARLAALTLLVFQAGATERPSAVTEPNAVGHESETPPAGSGLGDWLLPGPDLEAESSLRGSTPDVRRSSMANTKRRRASATVSREKRAARSQIQLGVKRLEKSIAEIQKSLRRAERTDRSRRTCAHSSAAQGSSRPAHGSRGEAPRSRAHPAEGVRRRRGILATGEAVGGRDPRRRGQQGCVVGGAPEEGPPALTQVLGAIRAATKR